MYYPPFVFTDEQFFSALQEGKTVNEMAKMFGVNRSSIYKRIWKYGIKVPFKKESLFNEHIFDCIDTEEKAYWLGFLYADGSVTIKGKRYVLELSLKSNDVEHLWKFNDFIGFDRKLCKVKLSDVHCGDIICRRCRISVFSKHLCNKLKELGCVPNKSLILRFPNISIFNDRKLVYDFIRGYIDGDGSLRVTGKLFSSLYISVLGTKEFIDGMINMLDLQKDSYHVRHEHINNTYTLYLKTKSSKEVASLIYGNATIYLGRKYERYRFAVLNGNI